MPRTAIVVEPLVKNDQVVLSAQFTTIDSALVTAGLSITGAGALKDGGLFLHVKNTAVAAKTVTIKAGAYAKAQDLVITVALSSEAFIGPFESSRFEQIGETYLIDFEAGTTGSIAVFNLPV